MDEDKWQSKQRSSSDYPLGRLRNSTATSKERNVENISIEFIKDYLLGHKKNRKKEPLHPPFTLLSKFYNPPKVKYQHRQITRKVLPPTKHHIFYSELDLPCGDKKNEFQQNVTRRKDMLTKCGGNAPPPAKFKEIGHMIGKPIESDPVDVVVAQFRNGVDKHTLDRIYKGREHQRTVHYDIDHHAYKGAIDSFRKDNQKILKTLNDGKWKKTAGELKTQDEILARGTGHLYNLLHETEHRLAAVAAGTPYLSHLSACNKRKEYEESVKAKLKEDTERFTHVQPAMLEADELKSTRQLGMRKSALYFNKTIKLATLNTNRERLLARKRQEFFDKTTSIHMLLCMMRNMKQPREDDPPLKWGVLKQLRMDPYAHSESRANKKKLKGHKSKRIQLHKPTAPQVPITAAQIEQPAQAEMKPAPPITDKSEKKQVKQLGRSILSQTAVNKPSVANLANKKRPRNMSFLQVNRMKDSQVKMIRQSAKFGTGQSARSGTPDYSQASNPYNYDLYNPDTITWEQFLRVGETELERVKRLKSSLRVRDRSRSPREDDAKSDSSTTSIIRAGNKISHVWDIMRTSFKTLLEKRTSENPLQLKSQSILMLNKFGLDQKSPVSLLRLNWYKSKHRCNLSTIRGMHQMDTESEQRYKTFKASSVAADTTKWTHDWFMDFKILKHELPPLDLEEYSESAERLVEEARQLNLEHHTITGGLIKRINRLCMDPIIKFTTATKGKAKIQQIIQSSPAFEICTYQMQRGLQFILVEILKGEDELLFNLFRARGLPLHPGLDHMSLLGMDIERLEKPPKFRNTAFAKTNKTTAFLPSCKPGKFDRRALNRIMKQPNPEI